MKCLESAQAEVEKKNDAIDVSTGDVITPDAVKYEFSGIFDEDIRIATVFPEKRIHGKF